MTTSKFRPNRKWLQYVLLCGVLLWFTCRQASAAGGADAKAEDFAGILLCLVVILVGAKLGGDIFVRMRQPAVLGELIFGILVGNLYLAGVPGLHFIRDSKSVEILSDIGVTLLLFQVGLESDLKRMMSVGLSSLLVATLGVITPFVLGALAAWYFLPNADIYTAIFIGATLCATSVGITSRVLLDLGKLKTKEAQIILGAAVIDDVQGLIVLTVMVGIIKAANSGAAALSAAAVTVVVLKSVLFVVAAIIIGRWISPKIFSFTSRLKSSDLLLTTALGLCFIFAYLSKVVGLAPIVGAFAAGLVLEEVHWRKFTDRGEQSVLDLISPLAAFMVPIFFVRMGAAVDLPGLAKPAVIGFAAILTLAAIAGKQICSLGVIERSLDKLSIGIGMIPRGEVGLIFAALGLQLVVGSKPVVNDEIFSAVVIMVVVTTLITPPLLKWSMGRGDRTKQAQKARQEVEEAQ